MRVVKNLLTEHFLGMSKKVSNWTNQSYSFEDRGLFVNIHKFLNFFILVKTNHRTAVAEDISHFRGLIIQQQKFSIVKIKSYGRLLNEGVYPTSPPFLPTMPYSTWMSVFMSIAPLSYFHHICKM